MNQRDTDRPSRVRVDDLVVDFDRRRVTRGDEAVDLTDRSFRLLAVLVRNAPEEVSKDQLIAEVWDDAVVSDETLAQRVRLLRQSLGDDSQDPKYIASVRGRGYRLVAAVSDVDEKPKIHRLPRPRWIPFAVAVAVLFFFWADPKPDDQKPDEPATGSLAVLPFIDMSADQDHQFFADGMHEELLSRLAEIENLSVVSRTSVERYRGQQVGLTAIAEQLNVSTIIEGSIRVNGDQLRVTVQLIDAPSDEHIWAANFDRQMSMHDIFDLQEDVANQIAESLQLEYTSAEDDNPLPTENIQAYNLYLLGRYHTFKQTRADLEQASDFLTQAIEIDPEFAEAYASLGWAYSFLGSEYGPNLPGEMYPKAKEAALRAISLDAELADARSLYADILTWYDWDFVAAEREYQNTLELDPLNVLGYALFLSTQERHEEAVAAIELRLATDPNEAYVHINAGWRYLHAGLNDKAADAARFGKEHADSNSLLGMSRLAEGDTQQAVEIFEAAMETQGRTFLNAANLCIAYFRDGRRAEAEALQREIEEFAEENYAAPGLLAGVYFAAGDADNGFAVLERAYEERTRDMIFLKVTETLRGYRDDPRYLDLVERVFGT